METKRQSVFNIAIAFFLALFVISGRWNLTRIFTVAIPTAGSFIFELRFWAVFILAVLSATLTSVNRAVYERTKIRQLHFMIQIFFLYLLSTAFWSYDMMVSYQKIIDIFMLMIALMSIYRIVISRNAGIIFDNFWSAILLIAGVLALAAIWQETILESKRVAVLGGGPNVFGRIMALLCLASLFFWKKYSRNWYWLILVVLSVNLIILSGSRGSIIAAAVAIIAFLGIEQFGIKRILIYSFVVVCLFAITLSQTRIGEKTRQAYDQRVQKLLLEERYTSGRTEIYKSAYDLGVDNPYWGAGLASFPALGLGVYPHNFFLEIFSEAGSIGLIFILMILVVFAYHCWMMRHYMDKRFFYGFLLILTASQFSGDMYDSRAIYAFMLLSFSMKAYKQQISG